MSTSESTSFFWRAMQTIECSPGYAEKRFDMNHTIDTEDKKVEDPGPCASILTSTLSLSKGRAVCRSGSPDRPVGDPADGAGATRQSAGRKAEKKRKLTPESPESPEPPVS